MIAYKPNPPGGDPIAQAWADMQERYQHGEPVRAEDYLDSDNSFWNDPDHVLDLVYAEYLTRTESGERPDRCELAARFPDLADRLERQLSVHEVLESGPFNTEAPATSGPAFIGKYRIITQLGRGGQATVYRGFHPGLERDVAVKLAHQPATRDHERMRTEGRALAALDHPGIVRVLDLDFHDGRPFLVTEFVEGRNLELVAAEKRLTPPQAAELVAKIARIVAAAHGRGVLHCDLKPGNILIGRDGQPWVMDFGLARLFAREGSSPSPGAFGTPGYMAPEQATDDPERLSVRTDVFGLGGVLYFLLTGSAPYTGDEISTIFQNVRVGNWDHAKLNRPEIPRRLREVCERALSPDSQARYATATDFATALSRSQSRRWLLAGAAACLAAGAWWMTRPEVLSVVVPPVATAPASTPSHTWPQPRIDVRAWFTNRYRDVIYSLPLRAGTELRYETDPLSGLHTSLFAIDPSGTVRELLTVGPDDPRPRLTFPADPNQSSRLEGAPGTVVVLLCGRADRRVATEEVRAAFDNAAWPVLPGESLIRLEKGKVFVEETVRKVGKATGRPDPEAAVLQRLDEARSRLAECDVLAGVAFSHN